MKTTYTYVVKKIYERNTICTVSADGIAPFDIEVPIISNDFEPVFPAGATNEEKTAIRTQARIDFRTALRAYIIDYFRGKDTEAAQVVSISPTILAIEGQSFTLNV